MDGAIVRYFFDDEGTGLSQVSCVGCGHCLRYFVISGILKSNISDLVFEKPRTGCSIKFSSAFVSQNYFLHHL